MGQLKSLQALTVSFKSVEIVKSKRNDQKMGLFGDSSEEIEHKVVDTTGQVNNNIIVQEARDTHDQLLVNEKLLLATSALVVFEVIKLVIYAFAVYKKKMKKAYSNQNNPQI